MIISAAISRSVLVLALVVTAALAWSVWRLPTEADTPAPALPARPVPAAPHLTLAADASDLPRGLLHATVSWPCVPGRQWLRFPRWIQGTHAPCGLVENLVNLAVRGGDGRPLVWARDPLDTHRFRVEVPPGCDRLTVALSYIANQPSTNSVSVDVLCTQGVAMLNWNNALLYPEGWRDTDLRVAASLRLPHGWRQASALDCASEADGVVTYTETDLRALLDAPVLCGANLAVHELPVEGFAPHRIAVATPGAAGAPETRALAQLRAVGAEARALWGTAPFARYTWLLALGGNFPHLGLEHLASSANGLSQDAWADAAGLEQGAAFLLAHEYGHAWIGKHHRPAGMLTSDCHAPLDTRLLWVYEGFDQYLGMILAARSGAVSRDDWFARLTSYIEYVAAGRSRTWRTLEDTAAAGHTLRGRSRNWAGLRGGQDYYLEGMLLCLEADGLIRRASGGARSFDDVLARLFATRGVGTVHPFAEDDVVAALRAVEPAIGWPELIHRRVRRAVPAFDLDALASWGMRATWSETRPGSEASAGLLDDRWSLGLLLWRGQIHDVVSGSPADAARLPLGAMILRVDDAPFSQAAWDRALRGLPAAGGRLRLRLRDEEGAESDVTLTCPRPRYLAIAPSEEAADRAILDAILAPRSPEGRAVRAAGGGW